MDFLKAKSPDSGLFEEATLSHFGPPTAPNKTLSASRQAFSVSGG